MADGPLFGDPARVEVEGSVTSVRAWRAAPEGLQRVATDLAEPVNLLPRTELFAGEQAALQAIYGAALSVAAVRDATALEALIGFSSIVHLVDDGGRELACGVGWHGTMPFVIEGEFPRQSDLAGKASWSTALTDEQTRWLRYAERYEHRAILDVRADGTAGDVRVLSNDAAGRRLEHLIDRDGVELERREPAPVDRRA